VPQSECYDVIIIIIIIIITITLIINTRVSFTSFWKWILLPQALKNG